MVSRTRVAQSPPGRSKRQRGLLGAAVLGLAVLVLHHPLTRAAYHASQRLDIVETRARLATWPQLTNAHFRIYYASGQQQEAGWVLEALDRALPYEEQNLAVTPHGRLTVVVYPSQAAMNEAVGVNPSANNIGYDYAGVIDILSPKTWLPNRQAFLAQGPAPHELGHALLNLKADGDYPAWFNEGVAQYEDWRTTGYQWITASNHLSGPLYSMSQLTGNFYDLSNQSRAYREGLALVKYLEQRQGVKGFHQFLQDLENGQSFTGALESQYHIASENALFSAWQASRR